MPSVMAMKTKKKAIATVLGWPSAVLTGALWGAVAPVACIRRSIVAPLALECVEVDVVVPVRPADVGPGEEPGDDDHQRPEQDADAQPARQEASHEWLVVGDQEDEPKVDRDHDGGQRDRVAQAGA